MIRVFVAVEIGEEARVGIAALQSELSGTRARVKWVKPENMHLTLLFIGDVVEDYVPKLETVVDKAAERSRAFRYGIKGVGFFGRRRLPRVIWAGLNGQLETLANLQQTLDAYLADVGFAKDTRAFKSHLTLGRVKGKIASDRMKAAMDKLKDFESEPFETRQIIL